MSVFSHDLFSSFSSSVCVSCQEPSSSPNFRHILSLTIITSNMTKKITQSNSHGAPISLSSSEQTTETKFVTSPFALPFHPAKCNIQQPAIPTTSPSVANGTTLKTYKQERKDNYQRKQNIVGEFARYFGEETKLENWQRLCRDVGVDYSLSSVRQCRVVSTLISSHSFC